MPAPGQVYRHYKGGLYTVLEVATETETKNLMVVYRCETTRNVWTRWLRDYSGGKSGWLDPVTSNDQLFARFSLVTD